MLRGHFSIHMCRPDIVGRCVSQLDSNNIFLFAGCLTTVGILGYGLYNFRHGKTRMSQRMMRWRIIAQGLTIVAIGVGVIATSGED